MSVETRRSVRAKVRRALLRGLADAAPVVIAVVAMGGAFVVATKTLEGSLRDALLGAVVGGFVTLITTLTAEEMRARADRREAERSVIVAIAHELTADQAELQRMTDSAAHVYLTLLPNKMWDRLEVELGRLWPPNDGDDVAKLAEIYWDLGQKNVGLRALGAPADESASANAVALPADIVGAMGDLRKEIETGKTILRRRYERLQ
jgi:hypothetical protein